MISSSPELLITPFSTRFAIICLYLASSIWRALYSFILNWSSLISDKYCASLMYSWSSMSSTYFISSYFALSFWRLIKKFDRPLETKPCYNECSLPEILFELSKAFLNSGKTSIVSLLLSIMHFFLSSSKEAIQFLKSAGIRVFIRRLHTGSLPKFQNQTLFGILGIL